MIPDIESSYQRIADAIAAALQDKWVEARIAAIFYPDSITWEPEFVKEDQKLLSFDVSLELIRAFRDLRRKFKDAGNPLWGQVYFTLKNDGSLSAKFGYENRDDNGDTIWNEEEWKRRQELRRIRLTSSQA